MLRVLQFVLVVFQQFPTPSGNSTRHARDMAAAPSSTASRPAAITWALNTITARDYPRSIHTRGYSATREQAMADFKSRWLS
jgi:hypothetical protein